MNKKTKTSGLGYVLQLAGKSKALLAIAAIFSVVSGACAFVPYLMVYEVITSLFTGTAEISQTLYFGTIAIVAIVLRFLSLVLALGFSHVGAFNTLYNIRSEITRKLAKINLGFFDNNSTGGIKKVMIEDTERIEKFLAHQIPDIVSAILVPLLMLIYMLYLNVAMSLCLLLPLVLGFVLMGISMKMTNKYNTAYHTLLGKLNSSTMEFINGMQVMKSFNVTADSFRAYSKTVKDYHEHWKTVTKVKGATFGIFVVLIDSGVLFSLPVGGFLYLNEQITLSVYIFFMIMSLIFLTTLKNLLNVAHVLNQIISGVDRIKEIMDIPTDETANKALSTNGSYEVRFENVTFAYNAKDVLHHVNMTIRPGSLVAFVGASGAGKSTAGQLIPRFWDVTRGSITIDGVNINDIKSENLMALVSFVFQENFMLNDTIYENIAIGKVGATMDEVITAASAAQIHDLIQSLPDGYSTQIGDSGVKLSGGERQRICIARAILKNAPVIIFDEATSFTDLENEHKIQQALDELLVGKTTIMIAHRLNTIKNADQIFLFDDGHIVEHGKHEELLKLNGQYAKTWDIYCNSSERQVG